MNRYFKLQRIPASLLLATAVAFASCSNQEEGPEVREGFTISIDDALTTRAIPSEIGTPLAKDFSLSIVSNDKGNVIYEGKYTSDFIEAGKGSYTLTASYGDNPLLAWDSPYYLGETQADITDDNPIVSVNIPCKVANSLISVRFVNPEVFGKLYSSYSVKVKNGSSTLDITKNNTDKSAYFRAGSDVSLEFHAVLDGSTQNVSMEIVSEDIPKTFEAGSHTILSLKASGATSGTVLTVEKVEIKKVTIAETIPNSWLPKPTVAGFGDSKTLTYTETADAPQGATINCSAYSPIQDIEITLDLKNPEFASLNNTYTVSTLTDEQRSQLEAAGIILPVIDNASKNGSIDLRTISSKLITDAGNDVTNSFKVRIKANDRWSSESGEEYKIIVTKPLFAVSIMAENAWSKEFTAEKITVNTGNAEKINSNLVYQYSSDGGKTWIDFTDGLTQRFPAHPDVKNYQIRACYRGCILSSNTAPIALESPVQLPNSDLESWYTEKLSSFTISDSWGKKATPYRFYPYSSGTTDIWWATNNERSQDGKIVLSMGHPVAFAPCVSYSETEVHGGSKSALIYTSGHSGGYVSTGEIIYTDGAIAGNLFIGTYKWSDANETITTGHSFDVRPGEFSFYYKYLPKGSDQFKVYVELRNGEEVIASGTYIPEASSEADSEFRMANITLNYSTLTKKATSIYVQFLSTTKTSFSSSDFNKDKSFTFPEMGSWKVHMGSMLYIDDMYLNYTK